MPSFMPQHKLEQIKEAGAGGGSSAPNAQAASASASAAPASPQEVETDELGYEVKKQNVDVKGAADAKSAAETEREKLRADNDAAKPDDEKIENKATGYGDEPPKVEEPPKKEEPPIKPDLPYELKVEGLPKEEIEKVVALAKKHSLTAEVAQDFADLRKSEIKAAEESAKAQAGEAERMRLKTRADWHTELKNDPVFGGEKFGFNVMQAEKMVQQFMPNTKKVLTERKSMLPPYVMRDLAQMASRLNATEKLGQGEAPTPPKKNDVDEALEFYN